MANTTEFIESGSAETQGLEFWNYSETGGTGSVTSSSQAVLGSVRSIAVATGASNGSAGVWQQGVMADAGRRVSFGFRFHGTPSPSSGAGSTFCWYSNNAGQYLIFTLGLNTSNVIVLTDDLNNQLAVGSTVLSADTDYRISFAYTITSKTVNTFSVYINGNLEISATNVTLNQNNGDSLGLDTGDTGWTSGANLTFYYAHIFVDNGTSGDPGNIRVTGKRAYASGTTVGWTGAGTPSGYGSGHAPYVNYRPLSGLTAHEAITSGTATTEEYNIENAATGDENLTGATIVDWVGWVYAKSSASKTCKMITAGTQTNISTTSTAQLFTKIAGSTSYPPGTGSDIGIINAATSATYTLYGAGILVAYIPSAGGVTAHNLTLLGVGT